MPARDTKLISASRRTDIPRFFARWFAQRRAAGFASFRNAFGVPGEVSLRREDVCGYLFWTKNARPFAAELEALRGEAMAYAFQYTINAYGSDIEPHLPARSRRLDDFCTVAAALPGPAAIEWRYDPILLAERYDLRFHRHHFQQLAGALSGATRVVNVSLVEPYLKAVRRMPPGIRYRPVAARHRTVRRDYPDLPKVGAEAADLLGELQAIANAHQIELRVCCNPEWQLPASRCCSAELFAPWGKELARRLEGLVARPTRDGCRCLASVDIGMDNTCLCGCKYCYVVTSQKSALQNYRRFVPGKESLR